MNLRVMAPLSHPTLPRWLYITNVLFVFAEFRKSLAQVATVSKFVPVLVGDSVGDLHGGIEVPVTRRELGAFL